MLLARYLRSRKINVLYEKIELSIEIQLKTLFCWLINKSQLKECLESSTRKRSAIIITVGTSEKVDKLCSNGQKFRRVLKVFEKY